jgi:hypothetical protein
VALEGREALLAPGLISNACAAEARHPNGKSPIAGAGFNSAV